MKWEEFREKAVKKQAGNVFEHFEHFEQAGDNQILNNRARGKIIIIKNNNNILNTYNSNPPVPVFNAQNAQKSPASKVELSPLRLAWSNPYPQGSRAARVESRRVVNEAVAELEALRK